MSKKPSLIKSINNTIQESIKNENIVVSDYTPFPDDMLKDGYVISLFTSDKGQEK